MSEVTTVGELIAQLPYALGFYPSAETIVVVSDATSRRLWDFPPDHSPVEVTTAIADLCPDTHAVRVTPMVYASQVGFGAEMDANDLATVLATTFPHVDTPVVVSPDGWRHAIDCAADCCPGPDLHPAVLPADLAHEANPVRADVTLATLRDLSRAAPDDLATAALSVWAHAAATRGDTPRALAAIHRAQKLTPRHHPTVVLRRLLIEGVDPATLAAVRLPEAALLATPTGITPAVVSTNGGSDGPVPLPPATAPPPAPPHRPIR